MAGNNDALNHKRTRPQETTGAVKGKFQPKGTSSEATYTAVDRDLLYAVIVEVTNAGGAIRFGLTSDGGAFALGIFENGDQTKVYVGANDDINATLREIGEHFHE